MLAHAAIGTPVADLLAAGLDALPRPDDALDVVTAVNALHLVEDPGTALAEVRRVLVPGGRFGIASWAERAPDEIDAV